MPPIIPQEGWVEKMKSRKPRNPDKREAILQFMIVYYKKNGHQPSIREIGSATGLSSTSTTAGYLNRMVRDGILGKSEKHYRTYFVKISSQEIKKQII